MNVMNSMEDVNISVPIQMAATIALVIMAIN